MAELIGARGDKGKANAGLDGAGAMGAAGDSAVHLRRLRLQKFEQGEEQ